MAQEFKLGDRVSRIPGYSIDRHQASGYIGVILSVGTAALHVKCVCHNADMYPSPSMCILIPATAAVEVPASSPSTCQCFSAPVEYCPIKSHSQRAAEFLARTSHAALNPNRVSSETIEIYKGEVLVEREIHASSQEEAEKKLETFAAVAPLAGKGQEGIRKVTVGKVTKIDERAC